MQAKKATSSRPLSTLVARAMQAVGVVITLSSIFDIIVSSIPFQLVDRDWQIEFVTQAVDRGIVPLVGVVLFLTGCWISNRSETEGKGFWLDPRFWALVLASALGAFYLVIFPLHLNNVRLAYQNSAQDISQQVADTEKQLNSQIETELKSQQEQISLLVSATDEQLDQLVKEGRLSADQRELVKKFKADPNSVEPFLTKQRQELNTQAQTKLGTSREQAQQQLKTNALKSGLRVGVGSLLLSIGFMVIGWLGLKNLKQL